MISVHTEKGKTNEVEQLTLWTYCNEYIGKEFADKWHIEQLPCEVAMPIIVENHYLHRICPSSYSFGLVDKNGHIDGVVNYGVPASSTLLKGICGEEEIYNVYELNRLWIRDSVQKNGESFLVGNTLKLLDKETIVSYADSSMGHIGYIYQATNFYYCGLSSQFLDPRVKGMEGMHHATFAHGMSNEEVIEKYGKDNVYFVERSRKHRYVYFSASKSRKKQLLKKLKYPILPYPKGDTTNHDISEKYGY